MPMPFRIQNDVGAEIHGRPRGLTALGSPLHQRVGRNAIFGVRNVRRSPRLGIAVDCGRAEARPYQESLAPLAYGEGLGVR
jgi:hypothetical protein